MTEIVRWTKKHKIFDLALGLADLFLGLSVCIYAVKMNYGAVLAAASLLLRLIALVLDERHDFGVTLNTFWAWFILTFALFLYKENAVHFEIHFAAAYILSMGLLLIPRYIQLEKVLKYIYYFSFFIVFGIWLQFLLPSVFDFLAKLYFTPTVYGEVMSRQASGYATGFTREVSYSALFLVIGLGYCFFLKKGKARFGLCAVYLATLFITGKKSQPVLAVLGIAVVAFMLLKNRKHRLIIAGTLVGSVVLVLACFPLWKHLPGLSRIAEFVDGILAGEDLNKLTNGRMTIYYRAVELWLEEVWLGIGWVNFRRLGAVASRPDTLWFKWFDVHNCYLQILCETGIIGFCMFMTLLVWTCVVLVKNFLKNKKDEKMHFAIYYFVFFVCYAMVEPSLYTDSYLLMFFLAIAYICQVRGEKPRAFSVRKRGRVGKL